MKKFILIKRYPGCPGKGELGIIYANFPSKNDNASPFYKRLLEGYAPACSDDYPALGSDLIENWIEYWQNLL